MLLGEGEGSEQENVVCSKEWELESVGTETENGLRITLLSCNSSSRVALR